MKILENYTELRNGYRLDVMLVRYDDYYADQGSTRDLPPHWEVDIDGEQMTQAAFNFPDSDYPGGGERAEAIARVQAYVDALPPGSREMTPSHFDLL